MAGSIEHLGGNRWRVRVYAGRNSRGKPRLVTKSFRASGIREARRIGHSLGDDLLAARPAKGTVAEAVEKWLAHRSANDASPTTMASSRSICRRIVADLGTVRLSELSARHIDAWYAELRRENIGTPGSPRRRTESTIHHHHRILATVLRQAEKWDMVDRVATAKATAPKKRPVRPTVPSPELLLRLLDACDTELRFAAALMARTGLRRGETVGLKWSDLDGTTLTVQRSIAQVGGTLTVKSTKTGRDREVDLGPETVAAFADHRVWLEAEAAKVRGRVSDDSWVFPRLAADTKSSLPLAPDSLTRRWAAVCRAAGVRVRLHDLRHWHATMLIAGGTSATEVADRLGHAQTSTTLNIYAHAMKAAGKQAALITDDLLNLKVAGLLAK